MINCKRYVSPKSQRKPGRRKKGGASTEHSLFKKYLGRQKYEQLLLNQLRKYVRENNDCMSEVREDCWKDNLIVAEEYIQETPFDNSGLYCSILDTNALKYSTTLKLLNESDEKTQRLENVPSFESSHAEMDLKNYRTKLFRLQPKIYLHKLKITSQQISKINRNPKLKELRIILHRIPLTTF